MDPGVIGLLSGLIAGSIASGPKVNGGSVAVPAISGKPSKVDFRVLLKEDCSSAGWLMTSIVQGPEHGYLAIRDAKGHPTFRKDNKRAKCNKLSVGGSLIEYTSKPGYRGPDIFSVETATSYGYTVTRVYYVTVK